MSTMPANPDKKVDAVVSKPSPVLPIPQTPSISQHHDAAQASTLLHSRTISTVSDSQMSRRYAASDSDEVTPIRHSASQIARNYNTNEPAIPSTTPPTAVQAPEPASTSEANNAASGNVGKKRLTEWFKSFCEKYGSVSLENKGSVARDHLALERTFLAWLRTSLAFASIGIAITQLFRLNTSLSSRAHVIDLAYSTTTTRIPFSPLLGHSLPAELAPYLQNVVAQYESTSLPPLGPTLLDQLFLLSADGKSVLSPDLFEQSKDIHAAATNNKIRHLGKPLGATFIGISILVLLVGFHRYFESQYWIIRGKFPASRGSVALVGAITAALIISSLVVIITVGPNTFERKK